MTKINILPPEEARKIAAGEVIEKPASLVREFMDNSLDASSSLIELSIEGGGIIRTEVSDDGEGMSRDDLELCCKTHATSKIRSLSDLETSETLGFRGEALAAAAAVSRLEILSSQDGREAWKLELGPDEKAGFSLEQSRRTKGTTIRSMGLFDTLPGRRRFLKREGSEGAACKNAFIEKALAFPDQGFRFVQEGKLNCFLPPDPSFRERFAKAVLRGNEGKFLYEITAQGPGFRAIIVIGGPELSRTDKRQQFIFANRRRIQDYSLLQALEYGVRGWFPNGAHPVGAVFIEIDPALADFNVHPAKREVRFADPGSIHHAITQCLENFRRRGFSGFSLEDRKEQEVPELWPGGKSLPNSPMAGHSPAAQGTIKEASLQILDIQNLAAMAYEDPADLAENPPMYRSVLPDPENIRYAGRLFNLFILAESDQRFYIIDQHAAHERILYDRFLSGPIPKQELLVAISFSTENAEEDQFLRTRQTDLMNLGVVIKEENNRWLIEALPADWRLSDTETIREILSLRNARDNMAESWAAALSCRGAVKDGDYLDPNAALALAKEALALPDPHCPHGRPLWLEIRREDIFRAVKRTKFT